MSPSMCISKLIFRCVFTSPILTRGLPLGMYSQRGGAQIYVQLQEVQYILYCFGLKCAHCSRTRPKLKFGYYLKFPLEVVGTCRCDDYQKVNKRAMALQTCGDMSNGENRHLNRWKSVAVLGANESQLYLASIYMLRLKSKNHAQSCSILFKMDCLHCKSCSISFGKQSGPERIRISLVLFLQLGFLKIKFLK